MNLVISSKKCKDMPTKNTDLTERFNSLKIWKQFWPRINDEHEVMLLKFQITVREIRSEKLSQYFLNKKVFSQSLIPLRIQSAQENIFQIIQDWELVSDFRDQAGLKLCSKTAFPWFSFGQWRTWNTPQNLAQFESFILVTLIPYKII